MHQTRRVPIVDLNNYLTCKLCKGYFIDATTIIECLHTFCRSCIVQYLNKNKYCPVCDVQVHKTKPLLNIRPDKTLQDIVYKLVPRLFQNEMCKRREFYTSHPEARPSNLEQCGEVSYQHILSPDETICLSLNYHGSTGPPRYLRCPTAVSVMHLQKLLRSKYDLSEHHRVDILHNQDCLNSHLTLIDIAYIYLWRRKGPLELTYRIYENTIKKFKSEKDSTTAGEDERISSENNANGEWKEVQLRISENGEMCFTGIDDCVIVNEQVPKNTNACDQKSATPPETKDVVAETKPNNELPPQSNDSLNTKKDVPALKLIGKENTTTTTTSIQSTIASIKSDASVEHVKNTATTSVASKTNYVTVTSDNATTIAESNSGPERLIGNKHKLPTTSEGEPTAKQPKQTILNHTLGIHNLSNNHPLKRHSQVRRSIESLGVVDAKCSNTTTIIVSTSPSTTTLNNIATNLTTVTVNSMPVSSIFSKQSVPSNRQLNSATQKWPPNRLQTTNLPCYAPKTTYNPVINVPKVQASTSASRIEQKVPTPQIPSSTQAPTILNNKLSVKTKTGSPIGYKTLRDPPKTWNPQISRASLLKSPDPKYGDLKNVRPAKFFKMRNNMPRYLGNPASGVKPLYQVHNSPEKDKNAETTSKPEKMEIKKHSIVKIDPKTLKPISEKAPEITSLSNQTDLKINTSSVPIFNPLKLQSSPKSDRKSPKSPHSPKPKSTSPSNKRDKLNLNYTPPNPFIPNLASPTLSPNQFLYPPGPPGFPTYDPRIMAAYHSLLYGQRSPYPSSPLPGLSLDLNQRKSFEMPPLTGQQFSPKSPSVSEVNSKTETLNTKNQNNTTKMGSGKRAGKESGKNEKSLENTVEKLTQNRVKELTKTDDSPKSENGRRTPHPDTKQQEENGNKEMLSNSKTKSDSNHVENSDSTLKTNESKQLPVKNDLKIKVDAELSDNNKNASSNNNNSVSVSLIADGKK